MSKSKFACAATNCAGSDEKIVDVAFMLYALPISCLKIRKKDIKTLLNKILSKRMKIVKILNS